MQVSSIAGSNPRKLYRPHCLLSSALSNKKQWSLTAAPSAHPRGAFFIVWKQSFLYDKKIPPPMTDLSVKDGGSSSFKLQALLCLSSRGTTLLCDRTHSLSGYRYLLKNSNIPKDTNIPPANNGCPPSQNTRNKIPLTVPSVVHLILRFLPGSHLPGLSGSAPVPLSPLHRFKLI